MYQKSTWSDKNYDFTNQLTTHGDSWKKTNSVTHSSTLYEGANESTKYTIKT